MPVLNMASFLAQAIESVLGQTYPALELLLQDGGSSDGTQSICSWYAARDGRIRVLPPLASNRGRAAARNALLAACQGDYIAWQDGDDVCVPERIFRQLSFLREHPACSAVATGIHVTDVALRILRTDTCLVDSPNSSVDHSCFATLLLTRAAAADAGSFCETGAAEHAEHDWLRRLSERQTIARLDDALYCRRLRRPPLSYEPQLAQAGGVLSKLARWRPFLQLFKWLGKAPPGDAQSVEGDDASTAGRSVAPRCQHTLRVAVHEGWGDFVESLGYLTALGDGRWGPVQFAPAVSVADADYHLVLNRPKADIDLRYRPDRLWFAIGEPPTRAHRSYHLGQASRSVVLTCDEQLGTRPQATTDRHYVLTPVVMRSWHVKRSFTELCAMEEIPKSRCMSWVTSNLTLLPGHRRRLAFLRAIRGRVPFDLYGRGFREIADKWDGIAPYRYSIAFENYRSNYYFTEKVMDCFVCLTLPLYYGSLELCRFFPKDSFIPIDPDDPHIIEKLLELSHSDLREQRLEALKEARWLILHRYNTYAQLGGMLLDDDLKRRPMHETMLTHRLRRVFPDFAAET